MLFSGGSLDKKMSGENTPGGRTSVWILGGEKQIQSNTKRGNITLLLKSLSVFGRIVVHKENNNNFCCEDAILEMNFCAQTAQPILLTRVYWSCLYQMSTFVYRKKLSSW